MELKAPRGTSDILPEESGRWRFLESSFANLCLIYGYGEIRTPVFEHAEVFTRSVGEESDIVSKETYTFSDRGGRRLTLRPEGTAAVVRAYLEHSLLNRPQPVKLYYSGPMFRYDRPQAGRYRQFHQLGAELFGSRAPAADAEIIFLAAAFLKALGITDAELELNSVGCPVCRPRYRDALYKFMQPLQGELCVDCRRRLAVNPLRLLDCKEERCRRLSGEAPLVSDLLCEDCHDHFERLRHFLSLGKLNYKLNPRLVRGLDYYTRTAFEMISHRLGAQGALVGGGRYDNLVELSGGSPTPGVGFAMGMERLLLAMDSQLENASSQQSVYVAYTGAELEGEALSLTQEIRARGVSAETELAGRSLKGQLKFAGRKGHAIVIIIGEREQEKGLLTWKEMAAGSQEEITRDELWRRLVSEK